jgi:hypothetical protein
MPIAIGMPLSIGVALAGSPKTRNLTGDILTSAGKVDVNFNVNLRGVAI